MIAFENIQSYKELPENLLSKIKHFFEHYKDLEKDFIEKRLHPQDLKKGVADAIIRILEPARKHFEKPEIKKMLEEMEELIITR